MTRLETYYIGSFDPLPKILFNFGYIVYCYGVEWVSIGNDWISMQKWFSASKEELQILRDMKGNKNEYLRL